MPHVRRAYNTFKGFMRGFSQDWAQAKVTRDAIRKKTAELNEVAKALNERLSFWDRADIWAEELERFFLPRSAAGGIDWVTAGRRMGAAGVAGLWGISQASDLMDRMANPNRGFFYDRRGRFDLPIIPFL